MILYLDMFIVVIDRLVIDENKMEIVCTELDDYIHGLTPM